MPQSDSSTPRFVDLSKLNPVRRFTCDVHGDRNVVMQFNPPANNAAEQIPDPTRLRCADCLEEVIPSRIRTVI